MENNEKKNSSMTLNVIFNGIKGVMSIFFPLISFPYATKILGVENIGKYNYAVSIISYFILFAGLGIKSYAIREGARLRDNQKKLNEFASQIFFINVISGIIVYGIFVVFLIITPFDKNFKTLLLILSMEVLASLLSVEWIYSIYEDFLFVTVRTVMFQILSLVLLFALVKTRDNLLLYAIIGVIAASGNNIVNFFRSKKYCKIKLSKNMDWKTHLRPIMTLFVSTISSVIYVNSDITVLGILSNDYYVGIYSVSVKIYKILKTILSAFIISAVPRIAFYLNEDNRKKYNLFASETYNAIIFFTIPIVAGTIFFRNEIVLLISNSEYIESVDSLLILSVALFFSILSWFWGDCILLTNRKENVCMAGGIVCAILNLSLNVMFTSYYKDIAVAFSTFLCEVVAFSFSMIMGHKLVKLQGIKSSVIKDMIGVGVMIALLLAFRQCIGTKGVMLFVNVIFGGAVYFGVEIILRNHVLIKFVKSVRNKAFKLFNI